MFKKDNDFLYYFSLFFILALGGAAIYIASPDRNLEIILVITTSFFYILWGLLHHFLNHDLDIMIVIEYILIALLGVVIGLFILKGGLGI